MSREGYVIILIVEYTHIKFKAAWILNSCQFPSNFYVDYVSEICVLISILQSKMLEIKIYSSIIRLSQSKMNYSWTNLSTGREVDFWEMNYEILKFWFSRFRRADPFRANRPPYLPLISDMTLSAIHSR